MESEQLRTVLEDAGLSPYQADAYVTLLELGSSPATEIAKNGSVPDPRIYDVLRDLEGKGYVETYEQDSLHARAHDPADVLADLRSRAKRFEAAAEEIEDRWSRPDIEEHRVSIVKRLETVLDRAETLVADADDQVQIALTPDQFDRLEDALAAARANDVDVRLCLSSPLHGGSTAPDRDRLAAACTEARRRDVPSPFVALVDRTWTCFAPNERSTNQYGVLVNDRTHAYVFHWFFLTCLWEIHETLYSGRNEDPPITYVDLRECVREVEPLLRESKTIRASVRGNLIATGEAVDLRGTVTDVAYDAGPEDGDGGTALPQLAGKVSLTLETSSGTYTVGGWGAMLEDVEATRITVETIA